MCEKTNQQSGQECWLTMCNRTGGWPCAAEISMIVSMFMSLHVNALWTPFATGKCINHGGKCGPQIPANSHFYVIIQIKESLHIV